MPCDPKEDLWFGYLLELWERDAFVLIPTLPRTIPRFLLVPLKIGLLPFLESSLLCPCPKWPGPFVETQGILKTKVVLANKLPAK